MFGTLWQLPSDTANIQGPTFFFFFKQSKNNTTFTIIKNKQNNNIPNLENTIYRTWKRKLNERGENDGEQINSVKKVNTQIIHLKLTGKSTSTLQNVTTKIWKSSKLSMKPTQGATEPSPFPMSGLVSSAACACNKKKKILQKLFLLHKKYSYIHWSLWSRKHINENIKNICSFPINLLLFVPQ